MTGAASTPTPRSTVTDVDLLPLGGAGADAAAGWTKESCEGLSFARPADWSLYVEASTPRQSVFQNPDVAALESTNAGILAENFRVNCDVVPLAWTGGSEASEEFKTQGVPTEDIEVFSLDVPGAEKAALWVASETGANSTNIAPPGTFTSAQIIVLTPDGTYYTVFFALPDGDTPYDIIRGVASSLSVD